MPTNNAWNSRNPAQETRGGTNQASYAQGDMLYASAANTLGKIAIGTSGYVLTSNGSTPYWATAASSGGSLVKLNSTTASSSSSVSWGNTIITGDYEFFFFTVVGLQTSATAAMYGRVSSDNGSTWISTLYTWADAGSTDAGSQTQMFLTAGVDAYSSTSRSSNFWGYLVSPYASDRVTTVYTQCAPIVSVSGVLPKDRTNIQKTQASHNAFQIYPASGTFSGVFTIYGVVP